MPPKPPAPTHFLCIPLAGPHLARSLAAFRADVTSPLSFGIPAGAVRPLGTLHLTLGVMSLRDESLGQALEVLRNLRLGDALAAARAGSSSTSASTESKVSSGAAGDGKLTISLQGLHPMQAASKTSVLYAPPLDPEGTLYRFCQNLRKPFLDSGIMTDDNRPLLLHATIINTIYVKGRARGERRQRLTIDARELLTRYDNYVWMEDMPVERVTLCRMGAKKIEGSDGDEAYEVEAEVEF
jgi:activating signal cointegrator complex subunit 1